MNKSNLTGGGYSSDRVSSSEKKLNVLSLCDGMSCGHIALDRVGIEVNQYFASEIKNIAIKVTKYNYPETIHIGDVNKVSYSNGILYTDEGEFETKIDLVIFGSPCQSFSIAMKSDMRIGIEDTKRSGLFLECYRILNEIKPRFFLMENVASMRKSDKDFITNLLKVKPIQINASLVSPALRNRLYWTNLIPKKEIQKKNIKLNDILITGWSDRDKARSLLVSDSRPLVNPVKMFHRYYSTGFTTLIFNSKDHYMSCVEEYKKICQGKKIRAIDLNNYVSNVFDGVRYLNQEELERCQCVPIGYTKCLTRNEAANVLGDGWNIDVIAYLFSGLLNDE